ncbi:MAG: hypothetical protein JO297_19300 [Nitrososphaeraceae archaeon]|nr:hypothetical protein [Nitrososphaeraceae archaeon]
MIDIDVSEDSIIPQEATKLKKLAKVTARYMEIEEFKGSDHQFSILCEAKSLRYCYR